MHIERNLAPVLASLALSCAPATQVKPAETSPAPEVSALISACSHNINDIVHAETTKVGSKIPGEDGKLYALPGRKLTANDPEMKISNLCDLGFDYKNRINTLHDKVKDKLKNTTLKPFDDSDEGNRERTTIAKLNHALSVYNVAYAIIEKAVTENRPLPEERLAIIKRDIREIEDILKYLD